MLEKYVETVRNIKESVHQNKRKNIFFYLRGIYRGTFKGHGVAFKPTHVAAVCLPRNITTFGATEISLEDGKSCD